MDILGIILFALSITFFVLGLSQFFGLGWAIFLVDLFGQSIVSADYAESQKIKPPSKTKKGKFIGFTFIGLSILFMLLVFTI